MPGAAHAPCPERASNDTGALIGVRRAIHSSFKFYLLGKSAVGAGAEEMRTRRRGLIWRMCAWTGTVSTLGMAVLSAPAQAIQVARWREANSPRPVSQLPCGKTRSLTAAQWKKADAARAAALVAGQKDVCDLTDRQMRLLRGGQMRYRPAALPARQTRRKLSPAAASARMKSLAVEATNNGGRNKYLCGIMGWHKAFRSVDLCTGNLFLSFTDLQVQSARGAGLALQRTYNSNDPNEGPFGVGWTHAYDIRIEEDSVTGDPNRVARTDFFGATHAYHRDADGLYTPPPYLYDELSSQYNSILTGGGMVDNDTDTSMDGSTKHYVQNSYMVAGTTYYERDCDYMQDRFGNRTVMTYSLVKNVDQSVSRPLLATVTDPSGRTLAFTWQDISTDPLNPHYRITSIIESPNVDGSCPEIDYAYFRPGDSDTNDANSCQLRYVAVGGRMTSYTYTSTSVPSMDQSSSITVNGLLASVIDALGTPNDPSGGHCTQYSYTGLVGIGNQMGAVDVVPTNPNPLQTALVYQVVEPGGLNYSSGNAPQLLYWTLSFCVDIYTGEEQVDDLWWAAVQQQQTPNLAAEITSARTLIPDLSCDILEAYGLFALDWYSHDPVTHNLLEAGEQDLPNPYSGGDEPSITKDDTYAYTQFGSVSQHTSLGAPASGTESTQYFNASGYFQRQSFTDMNGHVTTYGVGLDNDPNPGNRGNVLWIKNPDFANTGKQFTYVYNQYGQKIADENLNGCITLYNHNGDQWGNLTEVIQDSGGQNRTTTISYDEMGKMVTARDPNGQVASFAYNAQGQPQTATFPATPNNPQETISYEYEGNGRTQAVTVYRNINNNNTVFETASFAYEAGCDRLSSVTDQLAGAPAAEPITYEYGLTGERTQMQLPDGQIWTYTYCPYMLNTNPPQIYTTPDGKQSSIWPWVLPSGGDPDKIARNLVSITRTIGGVADCRCDFYASPMNRTWAVFNNEVLVTSGGNTTVTQFQQTNYLYDSSLSQTSTPASRFFLKTMQTTLYTAGTGGYSPVWSYANTYTQYDAVGNKMANEIDTNGISTLPSQRIENYTYDALDRVATVNYGDGESQQYQYDAMNNRTQLQDTTSGNATTDKYAYNPANMLLSRTLTGAYTNDLNGNTLTGGGRTNSWDSENRLVQCVMNGTTCQYVYGPDGLRRQQSVTNGGTTTTTNFVIDGSMDVQEVNPNATGGPAVVQTYLTGPRGPECRIDTTSGSPNYSFYLYDGLGSVVGEVNSAGNFISHRTYDVFGAPRSYSDAGGGKHKFVGNAGHQTDPETGLIYMRARYMDPAIGRFISEDPGRHGANWFVYCNDNPINMVDSNGKDATFSLATALAIIFSLCIAPWFNNPFVQGMLEDFVGLPLDAKWGQALASAITANVCYPLAFPVGGWGPTDLVFTIPDPASAILYVVAAYAVMMWTALVGDDIAFQDGQ
jgi:RHS repeat-associated protein